MRCSEVKRKDIIIKDVIRKMELVLNDRNEFVYGSNLDHDTLNKQDK